MIRKFKAQTMQEALQLAKRTFGDDTVILDTKKIENGGLFDTERNLVEITATTSEAIHEQAKEMTKQKPEVRPFYTPADSRKKTMTQAGPEKLDPQVYKQLQEIHTSINRMTDYLKTSKMLVLPQIFKYLTEAKGVESELASELVQRTFMRLEGKDVQDESKIREILMSEVSGLLRISETRPARQEAPNIICMVGPTGMGKTTSITKLATHPELFGRNRVAMITIDTYRVAAAAQLKTFAALAKIPLDIVYDPDEFRIALERFKNHEIILIDTAGRSPLNSSHLSDLKRFFQIRQPDEIHLVLSISTRADNLLDAVNNFSPLSINRLIISKLDETLRLGNILNVTSKINIPISFLTNGQRVPDDIHLADRDELANMIVN